MVEMLTQPYEMNCQFGLKKEVGVSRASSTNYGAEKQAKHATKSTLLPLRAVHSRNLPR